MASSLVGRKLGTYQITDLLGQGGMATVYKGYREDIDRYVAVKVLPPHPGLDQQFIERFKLEARTIARLQHPHILPLYDYGVEDDILYLVMAYVAGGSLAGRIDQGRLTAKEAETLLRQMAGALDYAHRQGVIHRDIKPDNILLDKEGNALLADFGIAKLTEGGTSRLTVTGGLVGTPAYMAPEQGRGDEITPSADIYSLGVVVYEMLTGVQPYKADTPMQVVIKHMQDPIPTVRSVVEELPTSLDLVMQRALAKSPQNRYKTAMEFTEDFTRAVHTDDSLAGMKPVEPSPNPTVKLGAVPAEPTQISAPAQPTLTASPSPYSNPLVLLGGFAIIAVLLVIVVVVVLGGRGGDAGSPTSIPATPTSEVVIAAEPTPIPQPSFGRVSFSTTNKFGDTVTLQLQNLKPPAEGKVYIAWLQSTGDVSLVKMGELTLDALGSGVMPPYVDSAGRILAAFYNAITLTLEKAGAQTPTGNVVYSAHVPPEVTRTLNQLFIASNDGIEVSRLQSSDYSPPIGSGSKAGLFDSIMGEAGKAQQHAGLAQLQVSGNKNVGGMHTHNEHTINILLGQQDDLDGVGGGQNPGFGVGLPPLLDLIQTRLDAAVNASSNMPAVQSGLELIGVCLDNSRIRVEQLLALEQQMLAANEIDATIDQAAKDSTVIAGALVNGRDDNGNGQIEPFENECGLKQIQTFGLLVSSMSLVEGGLG